MKHTPITLALLAGLSLSGTAQAALLDRGGGLIYDDVLGVTWLQDANYARTSGYDADGLMTRSEATAWTDQLVYGGISGWRLPTIYSPITYCNSGNWTYSGGGDCGFNARTTTGNMVISEMAYMYYVNLSLSAYFDPIGTGISPVDDWGIFGNATSNNVDNSSFGQKSLWPFENIQAYAYGLGKTNESGNHQFVFFMQHGEQSMFDSSSEVFAWAVRDGDVAAVPEPETYAMLLSGLGLIGIVALRRKTAQT